MLPSDIDTADAVRHLSSAPAQLSLSRRRFLQAIAGGATTAMAASMFSKDAWGAVPYGNRDGVLVVVTLYGGNDGLNTVVPYTNGTYYSKRGSIAIAANAVLPLDASFGLHPSLPFFKQQFDSGRLAIVHGCGVADPDFSHFTSLEHLMAGWGGVGPSTELTGWLGRYLDGIAQPDVLRSITIGWDSVPQLLVGRTQRGAALGPNADGFGLDLNPWRMPMYQGVRDMVAGSSALGPWGLPFAKTLRDQLDVGATVAPIYPTDYTGPRSIKEFLIAARLINANLGARVLHLSIGGFDTHANQPEDHASLLAELNDGLQLFWSNLSPYYQSRTTALVWSEFGRRLVANDSSGTDHGAAAPMFLMGPRVRGGFHSTHPSLTTTSTHDQLSMTVDYRAVYAQILDRWLSADSQQVLGRAYSGLDLFTATAGDDTPPPPPDLANSAAGFIPLTPTRMLDTRTGIGAPVGKVGQGSTISLKIGGVGSIPPTDASAVLINVTVTEPTSSGYVTVWPNGATRPKASNLNFAKGVTIPNLVMAKLGPDGKVAVFNAVGATHVVADVVGYFVESGGSGLVSLAPSRLIDTRSDAPGSIPQGGTIDLQISGRNGVPETGAQAVVMNVTAVDPTSAGYLTVWPTGEQRPLASSLNFVAGQTIPNLVVAKLGANGKVSVFNPAGTTDIVVDVVGYFSASEGCRNVPMAPHRLLDTRDNARTLRQGASLDLVVADIAGVPAMGVEAVTLNVTAVDPTSFGYVTVWPTGSDRPKASSLNFRPGETIPNLVVAKVGVANKVSFFNSQGNTDLVVDICGYYLPVPATIRAPKRP